MDPEQFEAAISHAERKTGRPEFAVRFGIPSDQVLLASEALKADLVIFGLDGPSGIQASSHTPWDAAYKGSERRALPSYNHTELKTARS